MSKLTTHQIAATLNTLRSTASRTSGKRQEKALRSVACYEAELAARIAAGEPDPMAGPRVEQETPARVSPAPRPAPIPAPLAPDNAVRDAEAMIAQWGTTQAVRAMCQALNNHTRYADSMPLEDASRVIAMRRSYAQ